MRPLRLVTRLDPAGAVEGELVERRAVVGGNRIEEEADVVAKLLAGDDPPSEPVVALGEDRHPRRPLAPLATGELVDFVAALAAEQLGQLAGRSGDEVDREGIGSAGDPAGPVLLRNADEEAGRVDAALGGEADEAAGQLALGPGRGDEHRVVEVTYQVVEGLRGAGVLLAHLSILAER